MKKIILTSVAAILTAIPAMAATFPTNEYMLENQTYTNAATFGNMGVYSDSVNANAEYEWILLSPAAGQYLPQSSTSVADCTDGSYCPGATDIHYDTTQDQGITACPTGYTHSDANASANTQCYRACDINNMGTSGTIASIAHATAISGNDYYNSTTTDTCEPTACESGYHVKAGTPDLMTVIGVSEAGVGFGSISNNGQFTHNESTYGITHNGEFVVDYGNKGKVHGYARCASRYVTNPFTENNGTFESDHFTEYLPESTGQYEQREFWCWCRLDGYTAYNSQTTIALSAPWVFNGLAGEVCAHNCAERCSNYLLLSDHPFPLAFRAAMFGAAGASPTMCVANTITINWSDTTQAEIDANNAGQCTYDGDIRTPRSATPVTGKTFKGWKFVKPSQN